MMIYARTAAEPLWGSIILERNVYEAGRGLREEVHDWVSVKMARIRRQIPWM